MGTHGASGLRARASTAGHQRTGSSETNSATWRTLNLSDWPVSRRLFTVIAMALVMGLVFGGLRVASAESSAAQFGRTVQLATLADRLTSLSNDLQNERDATIGILSSENQASLKPLYAKTDADIIAVQQAAAGIGGGFAANIQANLTQVLGNISAGRIKDLRGILEVPQSEFAVLNDYAALISTMTTLASQVAQGISDVQLVSDVQASSALATAKEQASEQRALLNFSFSNPEDANGNPVQLPQQASQVVVDSKTLSALEIASQAEITAESHFQAAATPAEAQFFRNTGALGGVKTVALARNIENAVFAGDANGGNTVLGGTGSLQSNGLNITTLSQAQRAWYTGMTGVINGMQQVETQIAGNVLARAQQLQQGAKQAALTTAVITVAVLLFVLLAALYVARSMVLPLRRLRASALNIASVQLPDRVREMSASPDTAANLKVQPIDVLSADEIGQVARAFDQVHAEAVRLAGEEAILRTSFNAMFVNLSRRSQSLIERLARMIDGLEQSEEDPDRLSGLFSMDHLVTRMRRNSENLLLLAGHENPRKWSEAVSLADVARAATSEIEQYNRVALTIGPGVAVIGQAVSDVVHLLAELIENATIFSPKDTQVQVTAQELSSGGVLIEITDKGIGVSETRLADMNWRLDNPPVMDVSVSRHMGLFAVARLAERHRVRVRLRPATPQGLSALVWLPESVIERTSRLATGSFPTQPASVGARRVPGQNRAAQRGGRTAITTGPPDQGYGEGGVALASNGGGQQQPRQSSGWFRGRSGTPLDPANGGSGGGNGAGFGGNGWGAGRNPADIVAEPAYNDQTSVGLPLRTPKANLIPGAPVGGLPTRGTSRPAGTAGTSGPGGPTGPGGGQSSSMPQRSPDRARNRLAGFQRGTRRAEEQAEQGPRAGEGSER